MKALHIKDIHMPSSHTFWMQTNNLLHDPRFWAVLAMVLITSLIITLAILTRPGGPGNVTPPVIPGPYIY